ncbi:MAG: phosphotransferase family protein [Candidatus Binatia bacterium]|nr:phosphotransferase family protein [Candidatus Binatia bacterium]
MSETVAPNPKRSSRDPEELRARMERWLAGQLPDGAAPRVPGVTSPSSNGMSSETLLFDANWTEGGAERSGKFVARVEPDPSDVPVFRKYDLDLQFRLMQLVGQNTKVPVPNARWIERGSEALGARFFVMDRVSGRVPPDVMPYNMDSWLLAATPVEQKQLEDHSVGILAELHSLDVSSLDVSFLELDVPGDTPLRRHVEDWRQYYDWARGDRRHPILDRGFAWLEEHWPADEGETVVNWGDSRIGNIMYDGFEPSAVLDWEMGGVAPRELDVSWMIFLHAFFEDIAKGAGLAGMPDFLRRENVAAAYEAKTGHEVRNLEFFEMYAAIRHGIIMARIFARQVHFGEAVWGEDIDAPIMHRGLIEKMLDGSYWE